MGENTTVDRRQLYKTILMMAWPIMVEEGLQTAVSYVDAAMVGRLGAYASAAVGITQTPSWLIWGLLHAASIGLISYVSQAMGAGEYSRTRRAGGQAILFTLLVGSLISVVSIATATSIPRWMGAEADIQGIAGRYFLILCIPTLLRSATINFGAVLRATGDTRTPMLVNIVVNLINVALNFFLIYPTRTITLFGAKAEIWGAGWGVEGAAIASAVAITAGGILMTVALFKNKYVCPQGRWFKPDKDIIAYCGKIAVPAGAQHVIISGGFVVFVALVAKLGTSSLAAHTIANTAEQAFYIPAYGLQGVAATMVGMAIGEGNEKKADSLVSMFQKSAFIVMGLLGALLFAFSPQLMSIFTPDTEVIKMGSAVLKIVAVAEPFFGLLTVSEGMLRGAGNLKPTVIISLCSMWGVRVFFTWFTLNVLNMDLIAVWVCMTADNLVRSLSYTYLFKTGKWKKTVNFNQKKTETQEIS